MRWKKQILSCRPVLDLIVGNWDMSNAIEDNIVKRKNWSTFYILYYTLLLVVFHSLKNILLYLCTSSYVWITLRLSRSYLESILFTLLLHELLYLAYGMETCIHYDYIIVITIMVLWDDVDGVNEVWWYVISEWLSVHLGLCIVLS